MINFKEKIQQVNPLSLKLWRTRKGVTFIEVIIIFTIIFIMTAVLLSTSYKDRNRKELQAVAREVIASIRETQNYSLTGKQTGSGTMPCEFQFQINDNSYIINHKTRILDAPNCNEAEWSSFFTEGGTNKLPFDIRIEAYMEDPDTGNFDTPVNTIEFDVPYGKITVNGGNINKGVAIILNKDDKKYYHLCLHTTGMIEDKGMSNEADNTKCTF